jgi:hypothetical protein
VQAGPAAEPLGLVAEDQAELQLLVS